MPKTAPSLLTGEVDRVRGILATSGHTWTRPRSGVLSPVDVAAPVTAEDIHVRLRRLPGGGGAPSSVYRTLNLLCSLGVARRVPLSDGARRYELVEGERDHHHHLICEACGRIEDVWQCPLEGADLGVSVRAHHLELFGVCMICLRRRDEGMAPMSPRELSLVLGVVAGLADLVGGALVAGRRQWNRTFLQYFLALGAGFMLAVAFLRMVPESFEKGSHAYLYVLIGYFVVHLTEHTLTPHFHFGEEIHSEALVHPSVGYLGLAGLGLHTFFDGVAIASGFMISHTLGFILFGAVLLHKLPEGFAVGSLMLAAVDRGGRRSSPRGPGTGDHRRRRLHERVHGDRGAGPRALGRRHDLRGGLGPDPRGQQGAELGRRPGGVRGGAALLRGRADPGGRRPPRPLRRPGAPPCARRCGLPGSNPRHPLRRVRRVRLAGASDVRVVVEGTAGSRGLPCAARSGSVTSARSRSPRSCILNAGDLMLTGKLVVGLSVLSLLGLASTWGLRALEARLSPWKEDDRALGSSPCASLR